MSSTHCFTGQPYRHPGSATIRFLAFRNSKVPDWALDVRDAPSAIENGINKYGEERAKERELVAQRMRVARRSFPADLIFNRTGLEPYIKAERKSMRAYALTLR